MEYIKIERPSRQEGNNGNGKSWNCEEQPELEGTYAYKETGVGQYKSTVYTIKQADEEVKVWAKKVLEELMNQIPLGSKIKIVHLGKKKAKNGITNYHDFDVFVAKDSNADAGAANANESNAEENNNDDTVPF